MFWASVLEVEVLKIGMLDVGSKSFTPQGETGNCGFLLNCMLLCQEWGLWQACVSAFPTHFHVGLSCSPNVQESSEGILSERILSCVAADSVCLWEKVYSASSEVAMLDQNSPSLYFFMGKKGIEMFLCLATCNRTNNGFIFLIY